MRNSKCFRFKMSLNNICFYLKKITIYSITSHHNQIFVLLASKCVCVWNVLDSFWVNLEEDQTWEIKSTMHFGFGVWRRRNISDRFVDEKLGKERWKRGWKSAFGVVDCIVNMCKVQMGAQFVIGITVVWAWVCDFDELFCFCLAKTGIT